MTKLATLRSVQRLAVLLMQNATLTEIDREFKCVAEGIAQLRPHTEVLPFPISPEMCLSEIGEQPPEAE